MNAQVTHNQESQRAREDVDASFNTYRGFQAMHHMAETLAHSTIIPEQFRTTIQVKDRYDNQAKKWLYKAEQNPSGVSNCIVALNMAQRLGADPMMVMQNLYLIDGRPSWSSQFIIAAINSSGRYSPLRFEVTGGDEEIEVPYATTEWIYNKSTQKREPVESNKTAKVKNYTCVAWVIERETGERLESSPISMELAVKEGWYQKNGSKWQTMPEQMLRYRAASFFGRIYAPDLLMGLRSTEEEQERIIDVTPEQETIVINASDFKNIKTQILKARNLNDLEELESSIYALSDEAERNELIKFWTAQSNKFKVTDVEATEAKKPESTQQEAPPVEEKKPTSAQVRKQMLDQINGFTNSQDLQAIIPFIQGDEILTDAHKTYVLNAVQQKIDELNKSKAPVVNEIKSISVKNGLIAQIQESKDVAELEVVAKRITENKAQMTDEHHQIVLTSYAQRKEILSQGDIFGEAQSAPDTAVDRAITRIEKCTTQDEINQVWAELESNPYNKFSPEEKLLIEQAAERREAEITA